MKVRVEFRPRRREPETVVLADDATAGDLLVAVKQGSASTLVVRNSTPIPEDAQLADGDEIMLLSAFSGG